MSVTVASLSGWANGRPLDVVLSAMAADETLVDVDVVELAIGAKPVADPLAVLGAWAGRFTFLAHHSVALGAGHLLRVDDDILASRLTHAGITRYSAHPPSRKLGDEEALWDWARRRWEHYAEAGIAFALEVMYPVRDRRDAAWGVGWHLDEPGAVQRFLDRADEAGWCAPVVLDGAHLHLGRCAGLWSEDDIDTLCARLAETGACAEAHVSTNDGLRDLHDRPGLRPELDHWAREIARAAGARFVVDEGRRRPEGRR